MKLLIARLILYGFIIGALLIIVSGMSTILNWFIYIPEARGGILLVLMPLPSFGVLYVLWWAAITYHTSNRERTPGISPGDIKESQ